MLARSTLGLSLNPIASAVRLPIVATSRVPVRLLQGPSNFQLTRLCHQLRGISPRQVQPQPRLQPLTKRLLHAQRQTQTQKNWLVQPPKCSRSYSSESQASSNANANANPGQSSGSGSGSGANNAGRGGASSGKKKLSLKDLTKKYGWTAVGVYFCLSALDLPLCYLFVHQLGEDRVRDLQNKVLSFFGYGKSSSESDQDAAGHSDNEGSSKSSSSSHDDWWSIFLTELTVAYAIHKTVFIFVRIPLTALLTPMVAKRLQQWGFKVGQAALNSSGSATATATKNFGTSPNTRQKWFSGFF